MTSFREQASSDFVDLDVQDRLLKLDVGVV